MIYFIGNKEEKYVKIGYTETTIRQRFLTLKSNCPFKLEILLTLDGMKNTEGYIHELLKSSHFRGEWYRITPEVQSFIDNPVFDKVIEETFRSTKRIKEEHDSTLEDMYRDNKSYHAIAEATGFTYHQIRTYVKRNKLNVKYKDTRRHLHPKNSKCRTPRIFEVPEPTKIKMG